MNPSPPSVERREGSRLSCIGKIRTSAGGIPAWETNWRTQLRDTPLRLRSGEQEALARVVPLLVCGEQSAIAVFGSAKNEHTSRQAYRMKSAFVRIEYDESGHEAAWQDLFASLPEPADLHALKRRAQLFFTGLGRKHTIGEHFAEVAQLDSIVGIMMWFLEHSAIARDARIKTLAKQIKQDEARHVSVSRHYAKALGIGKGESSHLGERIRADITELLHPVSDSLESIGIDADRMFRRINKRDNANLD